jgi:hypothetical protein
MGVHVGLAGEWNFALCRCGVGQRDEPSDSERARERSACEEFHVWFSWCL